MFFRFSIFRVVLFTGLCGICVLASVFGLRLVYFFGGEGSAYVYESGNLAVHFLDVGHGDCTIVQLPDGKVAVIDGGSDGEYSYYPRVKKYLDQRIKPKNDYIDYLINTHPHSDHLGGLVRIAQDYSIGTVYVAALPYPKEANTAFAEAQHSVKTFTDETIIENDFFEMRFHATAVIGNNVNEASPIIIIRYASQAFILTGDAGFPTEKTFFECPDVQKIYGQKGEYFAALTTILKVGHHGSRYSTGNPGLEFNFLNFIKPDIAVISVGTASMALYGHPHREVLQRLAEHKPQIYLTRDEGNIAIRCVGDTVNTYFAFDNPPDLTLIWMVAFFSLIFCFVNFERPCKPYTYRKV